MIWNTVKSMSEFKTSMRKKILKSSISHGLALILTITCATLVWGVLI